MEINEALEVGCRFLAKDKINAFLSKNMSTEKPTLGGDWEKLNIWTGFLGNVHLDMGLSIRRDHWTIVGLRSQMLAQI